MTATVLQHSAFLEVGVLVEGLEGEFAQHFAHLTALLVGLVERVGHTRPGGLVRIFELLVSHGWLLEYKL